MPNAQRMTNAQTRNDLRRARPGFGIGHSCLVILWSLVIGNWAFARGNRFQKRPAVLEQVVANGTCPQDAHQEADRLAFSGTGDADAHLLPEQAARADEANTGRRQVATEERERAPVLGFDLDRLDKVDAVLAAALDLAVGLVLTDKPADGLADLLLLLFLAQARADRGQVVVAALAVAKGGAGQGEHVFPQLL